MKKSLHQPVMLKEAMEHLNVRPGGVYIDATLGGGGHAERLLQQSAPDGRVVALDADCDFLASTAERLQKEYGDRITAHCTFYDHLAEVVGKARPEFTEGVDGILFDLGMSSWHLEESHRGFSFLREEVLDMRFNTREGPTADELLNTIDHEDLEHLIRAYGEERYAGRIAGAIIKARPIHTSAHLADIIVSVVPKSRGSVPARRSQRRREIHPATRTFQALRIAVNDELNRLERAIPQALDVVKPGGRIVVISFHSLEDRIVKRAFKQAAAEEKGIIITKKPLTPSRQEWQSNPRSRSAKLRVLEVL